MSVVRKAQELIGNIIQKGQGMLDGTMGDNATMVEMMIPGMKVGLIIGKGGETIKQLQVGFFTLFICVELKRVKQADVGGLIISFTVIRCGNIV